MITVRCQKCGLTVPNYASFCPRCGSSSTFFERVDDYYKESLPSGVYSNRNDPGGRTQVLNQSGNDSGNMPHYANIIGSGAVHDQSTRQRKIAYHTTPYGTAQPYILLENEEVEKNVYYQNQRYNAGPFPQEDSGRTVNLENTTYFGGVQYSAQGQDPETSYSYTGAYTPGYKPATAKLYRNLNEEQEDIRRRERDENNRRREKQWSNVKKDTKDVINETIQVYPFLGQILLVVVWILLQLLTVSYIVGLFRVISIGGIHLSIDITSSIMGAYVIGILFILLITYVPGRMAVILLKINAGVSAAIIMMLAAAFMSLFFAVFYPVADYRIIAVAGAIGSLAGLSFFQPKYKKPSTKKILWACILIIILTVLLGITGLPHLKYIVDIIVDAISSLVSYSSTV